ncbi:pyrroline-5-carboxylate reductase [Sporosarcina sp. NCCP-2222]|uniref:pyrroline-5-carboxylate reductase n=1 Tax=Sporosarcina sp. NCCP-2222 TaxID=2935073 RepID=UPI0020854F62|nr:pyrroline-5-carboxylate reductase [Sporosarcina sp. NCCP-2222]GKV54155.1 pyrroline-5-carboxylate reductase [Sporosarcina sp. NCCP-2222]
MNSIVFVGAGSMAEAIVAGIVKHDVMKAEQVYVMNKSDDDRLKEMKEKYGVAIVCPERRALKEADMIVLATKPKDIQQAMLEIAPLLHDGTAVLSVIAGVSIDTMENGLGSRPIARSMPNTSATIGKSASGVAFNRFVDDTLRTHILHLLGSIGIVKEVEEDELHAVTALSGSGPAYIYYMVEALEEAAMANGLSKEVARELIVQTVEGAAAMLKQTGGEPAVLRKNVTSPGGTTEAGLRTLEERMFKEAVAACISRAEARSRELGAMF